MDPTEPQMDPTGSGSRFVGGTRTVPPGYRTSKDWATGRRTGLWVEPKASLGLGPRGLSVR